MLWFQIDGTNFFVLSAAVPVAKASNSNLLRKPLALSLHSSRTRRRNLKAGGEFRLRASVAWACTRLL